MHLGKFSFNQRILKLGMSPECFSRGRREETSKLNAKENCTDQDQQVGNKGSDIDHGRDLTAFQNGEVVNMMDVHRHWLLWFYTKQSPLRSLNGTLNVPLPEHVKGTYSLQKINK